MDYPNSPSGYQDSMHFRQFQSLQYPSSVGQDKMTSSAHYRSDAITLQNVHDHPPIARQNSTGRRNINLEGFPGSGNYMPPLHQQHDVYSATGQLSQDLPRHSYSPSIRHHLSPQGWPPYDAAVDLNVPTGLSTSYDSFPSSSPYPPPRLSPPSSFSHGGVALGIHPLAGSLDPATGVFYRTPDHPRLRTAQACEKCRTRKAKCSGEHPSCKRCINRGLVCEYAKEGRVRGPNKPKAKPVVVADESLSPSRARIPSANALAGAGSSEHHDAASTLTSLRSTDSRLGHSHLRHSSSPTHSRGNSLSLDEHRPNRPRPPNLHLEVPPNQYRFVGMARPADMTERQSPRRDMFLQGSTVQGLVPYPTSQGTTMDMARVDPLERGSNNSSTSLMGYHETPISEHHVPQTNYEYETGYDASMSGTSMPLGDTYSPTQTFPPQGEYISMDFDSLHHAEATHPRLRQNAPSNLTPTWVEILPASGSGTDGAGGAPRFVSHISAEQGSSGFSIQTLDNSSLATHHHADGREGYFPKADCTGMVSEQDPRGGEGSAGPIGNTTHPNYQLDLRVD